MADQIAFRNANREASEAYQSGYNDVMKQARPQLERDSAKRGSQPARKLTPRGRKTKRRKVRKSGRQ